MTNYILQTGDHQQEIQFPQGYHDLTYGQFLRLRTENTSDIGHLLEILTGVPRAIWMKLPVAEASKVTSFLQWIIDSLIKWDELPIPETLHYKGQDYNIPKDLGLETFGQKIVLESHIAGVVGQMLKPAPKPGPAPTPVGVMQAAQRQAQTQLAAVIPYIVATYMQPRVTGKPFDEQEIPPVELEILNCRALEVYPIGNFFIRTLLGSLAPGRKPSPLIRQDLRAANYKKKQVSKKSKKKRGIS